MKLEELRQIANTVAVDFSEAPIIEDGNITNSSDENKYYAVSHGWNMPYCLACDKEWNGFNLELLEYIESQNYDSEYLDQVLNSIQTEDHHWDWFTKSALYNSDSFHWFFLQIDNSPQAACLIYQPETSALENRKIFYVKFLAVAPWNRSCLIREREYKGIGTILLKAALKYCIDELKLSPGFSLHSLPQATGYYEKLKMLHVEAHNDKDGLLYYELPSIEALSLIGRVKI